MVNLFLYKINKQTSTMSQQRKSNAMEGESPRKKSKREEIIGKNQKLMTEYYPYDQKKKLIKML